MLEAATYKMIFLNFLYIPFITLLVWLDVSSEQFMILSILLTIDFITGVKKVFILKGSLKSCRAISGFITKGLVLLLVLSLAFMAKGLNLDFELYLSLFISALIVSETYSIFGNTYSVITKEETTEFDAVAFVILKVRKKVENLVKAGRDEL